MEEAYIGDYIIYGLKKNPFKPAIADQRDADEIILEGTTYMQYVNRIVNEIKNVDKTTSTIILVYGRIGMGKTAIIKRAFREIGHKISPGKDIDYEVCEIDGKKIFTSFIRAREHNVNFLDLFHEFMRLINQAVLRLNESELNRLINNPIEYIKKVNEFAQKLNISSIVIAFDQLERVKEGSIIDAINFIRELMNSKNVGLVLILSSAREGELDNLKNAIKDYIGNIIPIHTMGLKRNEVTVLIAEMLRHYRIPGKNINGDQYYPFTLDGIETILDYIYRGQMAVPPRYIYDIFGNILDEAIIRGLVPIDHDRAQELLAIIGLFNIEWLEALNTPFSEFNNALNYIFRFLVTYLRSVSLNGNSIVFQALIDVKRQDVEDISQIILLREERKLSEEELKEFLGNLKKSITIILYIEVEGVPYVYLIKYGRRITRNSLKAFVKWVNEVNGFRWGNKVIGIDNAKYKIITLDWLHTTVEAELNALPAKVSIKIAAPWIIDSQDPQTYGAIMTLYKYLKDLGFSKAKYNNLVRSTIKHIVKSLLEDVIMEG